MIFYPRSSGCRVLISSSNDIFCHFESLLRKPCWIVSQKMTLNSSTMQPLKQPRSFGYNSSRIGSFYSTAAIKASLIILALETALGFFANAVLFMRLRKYRRNKTVYQILLQNLCLIGTFSSLIGMPSLFTTIFVSFVEWTRVPAAVCRARYFSLTFSFITDSINICLLSLDRYDSICRPFRRTITKENLKRYLAIIWVVPFLVGLLHLVIKIDSTSCVLISNAEGPYSEPMIVLLTVLFVLTCSFVVYTNWSSLKSMRHLAKRLNTSSESRTRSEKQMILLTVKIVATYMVSVAPTPLWSLALRVGGIKNCLFCNDMRIYLQLLLFVMYVANPFIFMGSTWKKKITLKRKIDVPENQISRGQNRKLVARGNGPFLVISRQSPADSTSFGGFYASRKSRRQRVAPSSKENKRNNIKMIPCGTEYANQGTQTLNFETLTVSGNRKPSDTTPNAVPIILLNKFVVN